MARSQPRLAPRRGQLGAAMLLMSLILAAAHTRPASAHASHGHATEPSADAAMLSLPPQQLVAEAERLRAAAAAGGMGAAVGRRSVAGARAAGMVGAALTADAAERIAARSGWRDVRSLQAELVADPSLKLDLATETLHYACAAPEADSQDPALASSLGAGAAAAPAAGAAAWEQRASLLPDPPPLSDAFKLHSRPSAQYVLILDFTGGHRETVLW